MNSIVDIAAESRITLPFGLMATFEARADTNEVLVGVDGNVSLGTNHDDLATESVVVREVVDIHKDSALGLPVAR